MDDSNELAQAIAGHFMMLLFKYGEVSAPNVRTYFKVRSHASKVCITKIRICLFPYETSRSAADLQQICFDQKRSTADYFIVCRVCFQSAADVKLEYPSRC